MVQRVKKLTAWFIFIVVFLAGAHFLARLLYPVNDIGQNWISFYALKRRSVDVLIVGSSHAYASFDAPLMEEYTGDNVYILATDAQNVEQAYFNVKEALRYQTPRQIVLEAYSLDGNDNYRNAYYRDRDWKKESNIDGMRFGMVKIQAVLSQYTCQDWVYAFAALSRCHENWANWDLIRENLELYRDGAKSFEPFRPRQTVMSEETMERYATAEKETDEYHIAESNVRYFRKLARLCRDRDIELKLVMAPMYDVYLASVNYASRTGQVAKLAEDEGIPYLDCNLYYEEIGLTAQDFEDSYNPNHHLNAAGAEKMTRFLLEEWK